MPIDPEREELLTLTEATKALPKMRGTRPAISTLWRWCRKGRRGVHLEYVRVGRNICTTREALWRFFVAAAEADEPLVGEPPADSPRPRRRRRTPHQRRRAADEAERRLIAAGA